METSIEDKITRAKQLFSQSFTQQAEEAKETMERLCKLYKSNADNTEVATIYAKGLLNLVNKLDIKEAVETVNKLEKLSKDNSDNQAVTVRYARALANLINEESFDAASVDIKRLETLHKEHKDDEEIAAGYVGGLANLALKGGDKAEIADIIDGMKAEYAHDEGFLRFADRAVDMLRNK